MSDPPDDPDLVERVFEAPKTVVPFFRDPQCRWRHRRNCDCRGEARKPIKIGSGE